MKIVISIILFCSLYVKAEVSSPAFLTLRPSIVQYLKVDKIGISGGFEAVVSNSFLDSYEFLKESLPLKLEPSVSLGGNVDENSMLAGYASAVLKFDYDSKIGVGAKLTYHLDQYKTTYSYTSMYVYSLTPVFIKDSLAVPYLGVRGRDLDYRKPFEEFKKLIGKRLDWFVGLNYNFDIVTNDISVNCEFHPIQKEVFFSFNYGL